MSVIQGPLKTDLELSDIDHQEAECFFNGFNADTAFELGCKLREAARLKAPPVLIQITSTNGIVYFQCCSRPGVVLDNEFWATRKRRTVLHFNRSTFYLGCKLRTEQRTVAQAFKLDESQYSVHGGGFPIRVRGAEGLQGVIVVSGLQQHEDHNLIYKTVKEFVKQN